MRTLFTGYTNPFIDVREHHRRQRKMLNPVFSIAHLREMSLLILTPHYFLFTLNSIPVPIFYNVTHSVSTPLLYFPVRFSPSLLSFGRQSR